MDSHLNVFTSNDVDHLHRLAEKLFDEGFFNCYLSPQLFNLFAYILKGYKEDPATNDKVWRALMDCTLFVKIDKRDQSSTAPPSIKIQSANGDETNEADDTTEDNENTDEITEEEELYIRPGYGSARNLCTMLRYLLYEKAVDYYFDEVGERDKKFKEFEIFEASDEEEEDLFKDAKETLQDAKDKVERDEEDDYDDEEDEEEYEGGKGDNDDEKEKLEEGTKKEGREEAKKDEPVNDSLEASAGAPLSLPATGPHGELIIEIPSTVITSKPDYPSLPEAFSSTEEAIGKMVHPILGTTSAIESSLEKRNELKLIKNFNKIYHNFENDLPNIVKRRRLEKSNKQLGIDSDSVDGEDGDEKEDRSVSKLMNLGGAVNLSLKNLLGRIEDHRDRLNITDIELKNLIMDVRKNRSKWASFNRIGQEELYEACEKVVTELRGYTEHSTPFLNRVSKREAPNYYQIIKKPMDLNTVMRKMRTLQYNSKKAFVDDLMLIWQNCLTYNTDPKHFLRVDALAMQKKTLSLVQLIPDITIRDRADVEREAAIAAQQEKEEAKKSTKSSRAVGNSDSSEKKSAKKGRKGGQPDETPDGTVEQAPFNEEEKEENEHEEVIEPQLPSAASADVSSVEHQPSQATPAPATATESTNADDDNEDADSNLDEAQSRDDEDDDEPAEDLEMSTWKTLTSNTRYKLCEARTKMFKDNQIHMNVESLYRDNNQMLNFLSYLDDGASVVLHKNRRYFDENDDPYLIEYDVGGGVPDIKFQGVDFDELENSIMEKMLAKGETLESQPPSSFKVEERGSVNLVLDNISAMQDIRKVCFRINLIRQMQTSQFVHRSQFHPPVVQRIKFTDLDPMFKLPTRDAMNPQVAAQCLKKSVSAILMANGFESTNPFCVSMVTQIAEEYFGNLAKSLKLHMESNSINKLPIKGDSPISLKDIIFMALGENGVDKPDVIYTYYREYLTKKNKKLKDLKEALEGFLKDLLRPGLQDLTETQFNDNSEQFLTGEFSDELGEDFFGFRELGLDREFGMLTSSVPLHLLHSRLSLQFNQSGNKTKKDKFDDFNEVKFPKLRQEDLPKQIHLLKHYYDGLLLKTKNMYAKQLKKHQQHLANGTADPSESFVEYKNDEDMVIIEDDDLPMKQRNNRPKIPPNGKITQIKKKFIANAFFIDRQDEWVRKEKLGNGDVTPTGEELVGGIESSPVAAPAAE
ncbi:DEKNAAC104269 [Brettanomyces naardenensis]|uniref:SAGA complex subunit Spt7 n=1 Tax=Brettanomyces naardenensis TaxID=13370 RepID=A0A448YQ14_BRENA|nr:DEKNAAC104269 [Brettanomyces naardenensis]